MTLPLGEVSSTMFIVHPFGRSKNGLTKKQNHPALKLRPYPLAGLVQLAISNALLRSYCKLEFH